MSEDALARRVRELGEELSRDYEGKDLLLLGILKGAVFFLSDLMRGYDESQFRMRIGIMIQLLLILRPGAPGYDHRPAAAKSSN